jgi:hypothetical protein
MQVSVFDKGSSSVRGTHLNFSPMMNTVDGCGTVLGGTQVGCHISSPSKKLGIELTVYITT